MRESTLRTKIVRKLNSYSGWWVVTHGEMFQETGLPDIVGCYAGKFYGLEVKIPTKLHTLTARQSRVLGRIRDEGGRATIVTSVDEAMNFVFNEPP